MTNTEENYIDLENYRSNSEQNTCYKECKLGCWTFLVDLANLLIPCCLIFSLIALIMFIVLKFSL